MVLMSLLGMLIVICGGLALVASKLEGGLGTVATILAAIVGGLISAISQEFYRREENRSREKECLSALRVEVELNLKISNEGRDEKRRLYSTSAWESFRPHLWLLKPDVARLLMAGFGAAYMHRQALQVELTHANQGPALMDYSGILCASFSGVMALSDWRTQ